MNSRWPKGVQAALPYVVIGKCIVIFSYLLLDVDQVPSRVHGAVPSPGLYHFGMRGPIPGPQLVPLLHSGDLRYEEDTMYRNKEGFESKEKAPFLWREPLDESSLPKIEGESPD